MCTQVAILHNTNVNISSYDVFNTLLVFEIGIHLEHI